MNSILLNSNLLILVKLGILNKDQTLPKKWKIKPIWWITKKIAAELTLTPLRSRPLRLSHYSLFSITQEGNGWTPVKYTFHFYSYISVSICSSFHFWRTDRNQHPKPWTLKKEIDTDQHSMSLTSNTFWKESDFKMNRIIHKNRPVAWKVNPFCKTSKPQNTMRALFTSYLDFTSVESDLCSIKQRYLSASMWNSLNNRLMAHQEKYPFSARKQDLK